MLGSTPTGVEFLQCAIAPVDFPGTRPGGVPDKMSAPSFVIRHKMVMTLPGSAAGTYMLVAPTPGVACWLNQTGPTGSYTSVPFPDFVSIFGNTAAAPFGTINAEKFRYISINVEMKPVSAILNNAGLISAARIPGVTINDDITPTNVVTRYMTGLTTVNSTNLSTMPGYFMGHVNQGVYGWAINETGTWEVRPLWINTQGLNGVDAGQTGGGFEMSGPVMGWGDLTPLGISVEATNAQTSFALIIEACVEYFPRAGTMISEMSSPSPPLDEEALEVYSFAARKMPAFVPADKNAGFWDLFLGLVSSAAGTIAPFLGPVGMGIATGISAVAGGIRSLIV